MKRIGLDLLTLACLALSLLGLAAEIFFWVTR